jgi:hypothetical protein
LVEALDNLARVLDKLSNEVYSRGTVIVESAYASPLARYCLDVSLAIWEVS